MASANKVILLGNLGKDPEYKQFDGGKEKTSFSLATTEKFGEKENTQWHNIVMWGKVAKVASDYLKKGSQVYLEGRVTYRDYEDKDGNKRHITEIVCDQMQMLTKKQAESSAPADPDPLDAALNTPEPPKKGRKAAAPAEDNGDLPF